MTIGPHLVAILLALGCFALAFFKEPRFDWTAGGFFFTLIAFTLVP